MNLIPHLLLSLACFLWSLNFILSKILAGVIPAYSVTFLRWILPALAYTPIAWRELREHGGLFMAHWKLLLLLVFTGYSANSFSVYLAMHYTTAINASFLASFNPVVFAFLAFLFYREKVSFLQSIGIVISIAGVLWIVFQGNPAEIFVLRVNPGDLLMMVSITSWAIYSLIYKKKTSALPQKSLILLLFWGGVIFNLPIFLVENTIKGWAWIGHLESRHLLALLGLNVFPSFLAFLCWNMALLKVSANQASMYLNLVPVSTSFLSLLFLGEKLQVSTLAGGLLILAGVVLVTNSQAISKKLLGFIPFKQEAQP